MNNSLTIGDCIKINAMLDNGLAGMDEDGHIISPNEPILVENVIRTQSIDLKDDITFIECHFMYEDYLIGYLDNLNLNGRRSIRSIWEDLPMVHDGEVYMWHKFVSSDGSVKYLLAGWVTAEPGWTKDEIVTAMFYQVFGCYKFPVIFQEEEE